MDSLALLCNLYGDGPATLKRLRSAGCASVDVLAGLDAADLAEILGTSQPAARRFLREARLLLERVGARELDEEERPPISTGSAAPPPADPAPPLEELASPESFGAEPEEDTPLEAEDADDDESAPLIDAVLATWRERDGRAGAEHDVEFAPEEIPAAAPAPARARPAGTPLRPRLLDGLDRGWCERLVGAGVATVEELARAEPLALSRAAGAGLTQVMRLQFLARRLVSERGEVETPEPPAVLRPMNRRAPPHGDKFSAAEVPFGALPGSLAPELDEVAGRAAEAPAPDEGSGGPFARG